MDGLTIDQLEWQQDELRRIQKELDEESAAYIDDAIQSLSLAIDADSDEVEPQYLSGRLEIDGFLFLPPVFREFIWVYSL